MSTSDRPDLEQLTNLCTPWCVHTVATLRIAEHMAAGATAVADLAAAAGCDPRALGSVLRHLVSKGLFGQPEPGHFILNDLSSQLLHAGPFLDLGGIAGRMAYPWGTLPTYLRTGRPRARGRMPAHRRVRRPASPRRTGGCRPRSPG